MLKVFQKINLIGQVLDVTKLTRCFNALQSNIQTVLDQIILDPFIDGSTLLDINIIAGAKNAINHSLGRKPIGYVIISKDQEGDIWSYQRTNPSSDKTLILGSNQNMVISLRIF